MCMGAGDSVDHTGKRLKKSRCKRRLEVGEGIRMNPLDSF